MLCIRYTSLPAKVKFAVYHSYCTYAHEARGNYALKFRMKSVVCDVLSTAVWRAPGVQNSQFEITREAIEEWVVCITFISIFTVVEDNLHRICTLRSTSIDGKLLHVKHYLMQCNKNFIP